jgi:ATP-dependent DNA helicase RecQ
MTRTAWPASPPSDARIRLVLRETFRVGRLRPGQREVIERVLRRQNTLALMPTGAGKSLCFQLPALLLPGHTLVVSPLIALMQDQCDHLQALGIRAVQWHSAQDATAQADAQQRWLDGRARIAFITPERLLQHDFMALVRRQRVSLLVVDEAHCISQWGHDFRPAYQALGQAAAALKGATVLALTATATDEVRDDIRNTLRIPAAGVVASDSHRPNLNLAVDAAQDEAHKLPRVLAHLTRCHGPALIYTTTVKAAEALHQALQAAGVAAGLYHGRLPAVARAAAQQAFMQGEVQTMVATNAFGLGVDKPDIRLVLHHQLPASLDVYYQEAGRAGRDGQPADCVLLYLRRDRAVQQFFLNGRYPDEDDAAALLKALATPAPTEAGWTVPALRERLARPLARLKVLGMLLRKAGWLDGPADGPWRLVGAPPPPQAVGQLLQGYEERAERDHERLEAMVAYAQSGQCRWRRLLESFDEPLPFVRCNHCDNCRRIAEHEAAQATASASASASAEDAPNEAPAPGTDTAARLAPGMLVRVNRYGRGTVVTSDWDSVTVSFAGRERTFHRDFVRVAPRANTVSGQRRAATGR